MKLNQESTKRQVLIWLLHEEIENCQIPAGEDFLQRTAGKLGRNNKIQNMGFFQKIPNY